MNRLLVFGLVKMYSLRKEEIFLKALEMIQRVPHSSDFPGTGFQN